MGIFALYDIMSIQKYIYSSNRLRDNQGASELVGRCFSELLLKTIEKKAEEGIFSKVSLDWETKPEAVAFLEDSEVDCEVLYIGGGNALLYFKDETGTAWKNINETFSAALLKEMPGLGVVTETAKNTGDFGRDLDQLFKKLQLKKYKSRGWKDAPCLSVTRECVWSGKPAVAQGADGNWISEEIVKKREASGQKISREIYKEMGDLAGPEGEQWVAVVHVDGNRMGDSIRKLTMGKDLKEGVTVLRKFSREIGKLYDAAYEKMTAWCAEWIQRSSDFRLKFYKEKPEPPFRKIYGAGDDLTFLCYGPLAICAAEQFLKNLEEGREENTYFQKNQIATYACAGIAFLKPGYPFSKAYEIAEACCRSAKKRSIKEMGSYLDFQVIYGGLNSLKQMREAQMGESSKKMLRPYRTACSDKEELKNFYLISDWLVDSKIARSKWKELRNALDEGEMALKKSMGRLRRNNNEEITKLLALLNENHVLVDVDTDGSDSGIIWDGLEMMDLYVKDNGDREAEDEADNRTIE